MIKGIGIDLVSVNRIKRAATNARFLRKCFSSAEIEAYNKRNQNPQFLAGNFAAKEAVAKALGTGFTSFFPRDIEVLRNKSGKPFINLTGNAKTTAAAFGEFVIHVSITNTKHLAAAVAVLA